jgi:hypothetical protein
MVLLPAFLSFEIFVSYPFSISTVLKTYGQHLKAPAAMVRLRLYETLSLLPPHAFEGKFYVDECRMELTFKCCVTRTAPPSFVPLRLHIIKYNLGIQ